MLGPKPRPEGNKSPQSGPNLGVRLPTEDFLHVVDSSCVKQSRIAQSAKTRFHDLTQGPPQPSADRNHETPFGGRDRQLPVDLSADLSQQILQRSSLGQQDISRQSKRPFNQVTVEKGNTNFQRVCHSEDVAVPQQNILQVECSIQSGHGRQQIGGYVATLVLQFRNLKVF